MIPYTRRELLWLALTAGGASRRSAGAQETAPDVTLRIEPVTLDLGPKASVRTIGYNGQVPGPVIRMREGRLFTAEVNNQSNGPELLHWHGLHIAPEVDGAMEEGTPMIAPNASQRYSFVPRPSGTRWYHSHSAMAKGVTRSTFTGQFGLLIVEGANDPGAYDLDIPILLHEWGPQEVDHDVEYRWYSINGKMLGAGEPVRVREGQKALFRLVNASASESHRLALPGHVFEILSLDGNSVPKRVRTPVVELGPGERADALVEMNRPGVWVLGSTRDKDRLAGCGIVVEYAGQQGAPRWVPAPSLAWDYTAFGASQEASGPAAAQPHPDGRFTMVFRETSSGKWTINGKSYPHTEPMVVSAGRRYRMTFDNQSAMAHPVHLHRHSFEITRFDGKATAGVWKDVVVVPAWKEVEVDLIAENPGVSLFHCHHQLHMDRGFMTVMQYAS